MTVLQLGALALSTLGAAEAPEANANEWTGLDQEIESLASSLGAQDGGVDISGFFRARWTYSGDAMSQVSGDDWSSFAVTNARLNFTGTVGDYGFKIQPDFGTGSSNSSASSSLSGSSILKDAKAWWNCGEFFKLTFGRYKVPFSRDYMTSQNQLLFLDRTLSGGADIPTYGLTEVGVTAGVSYSVRDEGIMGSGNYEKFDYWISAQNGDDSNGANYRWTLRGQYDFLADSAAHQGGYGLSDEAALNVGLAYTNDTGIYLAGQNLDGDSITLDATFQMNPFTLLGAVYFNGDDLGDNTPWDLAGSWMFTPEWEAAIRYETSDKGSVDPNGLSETDVLTLGVNWYLYGPDSKWQLNLVNYDSVQQNPVDVDDAVDGLVIVLGLTLSF
jgi:hypothetical protein